MTARRDFLRTGILAGGFVGLQRALGAPTESGARLCEGYGGLVTDAEKVMDLPKGFSYQVLSRRGGRMSDGFQVPGAPDGMAAFPGKDGRVVVVRNHELTLGSSAWGALPNTKSYPEGVPCYDAGAEGELVYQGGTTHLIYNPATGEVEKEFLSLVGTDRNCAGGPTPWGSWITCEEPELMIEGRGKNHGWCFEVRADAEGVEEPVALKGLGRFRHEAVAVDPKTGVVFLTEDRHEGLFYRFVPRVKGDLSRGGKLQALALWGQRRSDSRNWRGKTMEEGKAVKMKWIDLEDTDSPKDDLRIRGARAGATVFARGEGCWWGDGEVWFCCTNGGPEKRGQLFRLTPKGDGGELELFLQPRKSELLTNGDNLTVASNGDIIIAEDRGDDRCSLRGVTAEGKVYTLATNRMNASELAGVCFSPDGETLFVNIQNPGLTLAIKGDWSSRRS
ncbi:MAG: alkaline phosphatase PhoX [Roseibacillus sp.]